MANILYKAFRGDELLKIDVDNLTVDNLYRSEHNQRIYGSMIIIKEAGILIDEKNGNQVVEAGDVVFANYEQLAVIKNTDFYNSVVAQLEKNKKEMELCEAPKCGDATDATMSESN